MPVTVRRLGPGDVERMRALNALFGRAFSDPNTYGAAPPNETYLTRWLAQAHVFALIAEIDGTVVGGLVAMNCKSSSGRAARCTSTTSRWRRSTAAAASPPR